MIVLRNSQAYILVLSYTLMIIIWLFSFSITTDNDSLMMIVWYSCQVVGHNFFSWCNSFCMTSINSLIAVVCRRHLHSIYKCAYRKNNNPISSNWRRFDFFFFFVYDYACSLCNLIFLYTLLSAVYTRINRFESSFLNWWLWKSGGIRLTQTHTQDEETEIATKKN